MIEVTLKQFERLQEDSQHTVQPHTFTTLHLTSSLNSSPSPWIQKMSATVLAFSQKCCGKPTFMNCRDSPGQLGVSNQASSQ